MPLFVAIILFVILAVNESNGLRVSLGWFLMVVPVGFTLIIARLTHFLIRDFRNGFPDIYN